MSRKILNKCWKKTTRLECMFHALSSGTNHWFPVFKNFWEVRLFMITTNCEWIDEPRKSLWRSVHTVRQRLRQRQRYQLDSTDVRQIVVLMYVAGAAASQNGVRTHLLVAPLPQPHQCEQVHLIQWNPIVTATFSCRCCRRCRTVWTDFKTVKDTFAVSDSINSLKTFTIGT